MVKKPQSRPQSPSKQAPAKQTPVKKPRPQSPSAASTITTTTVSDSKSGRSKTYTTRVEKSKPKYSFKIETSTRAEAAIPEEIEFNGKHFFTNFGILKILQLIVAVLCMIFFSPPLTWFTRILCTVVAICFAITIYICLHYMFTLYRILYPNWPWLKIEMIYTYVAAISYLISSIVHLIFTNTQEFKTALLYHDYFNNYIIAGAFGIVNFVLYAILAQFLQNKWKRYVERRPKVYIVRTTLDKKGKPVKKTVTQHNI